MRLELSLNNSGNKKATLDERLFGKARHTTHMLTLVPFIKQRIRQLSDNQFHENTTDKMTFFKTNDT